MVADLTTQQPTIFDRAFNAEYGSTSEMQGWFDVGVAAKRTVQVFATLELPPDEQKACEWKFWRMNHIDNPLTATGLHTNFFHRGMAIKYCINSVSENREELAPGNTITVLAREDVPGTPLKWIKFQEVKDLSGETLSLLVDLRIEDHSSSLYGNVRILQRVNQEPLLLLMIPQQTAAGGDKLAEVSEIPSKSAREYVKQLLQGVHPLEIITGRFLPVAA